ncbi:hypothetical protein HK102_011796 [Quaeritorhiza haematococci]|nr:hypothetical protein HK102_011796 [Quaeritorhiza haematococci]
MSVVNTRPTTLRLMWRGFDCSPRQYALIAPGTTFRQQTFATHVWFVTTTDSPDRLVDSYVARASPNDQQWQVASTPAALPSPRTTTTTTQSLSPSISPSSDPSQPTSTTPPMAPPAGESSNPGDPARTPGPLNTPLPTGSVLSGPKFADAHGAPVASSPSDKRNATPGPGETEGDDPRSRTLFIALIAVIAAVFGGLVTSGVTLYMRRRARRKKKRAGNNNISNHAFANLSKRDQFSTLVVDIDDEEKRSPLSILSPFTSTTYNTYPSAPHPPPPAANVLPHTFTSSAILSSSYGTWLSRKNVFSDSDAMTEVTDLSRTITLESRAVPYPINTARPTSSVASTTMPLELSSPLPIELSTPLPSGMFSFTDPSSAPTVPATPVVTPITQCSQEKSAVTSPTSP